MENAAGGTDNQDLENPDEGEATEISVDVTEDNMVWIHSGESEEEPEWELYLTPEESRLFGQALLDAADDAEEGTE